MLRNENDCVSVYGLQLSTYRSDYQLVITKEEIKKILEKY